MTDEINISDYDYNLPQERIAKFPTQERGCSKLLVYNSRDISQRMFGELTDVLPEGSMLVFNNTKVVRARIIMHKQSGARIELFCLKPYDPADYEQAFSVVGECLWTCIVGNSKKWKEGPLFVPFVYQDCESAILAQRIENNGVESTIRFTWDSPITFGQVLEILGRIPIPPYLGRDSQEIDNTRYQTVYSRLEGSVAAPTAGLHFSNSMVAELHEKGFKTAEVTLHVGAGTFLPVKSDDVSEHQMHTEYFEVDLVGLEEIVANVGKIVAVGTTTVRTLESMTGLGYRVLTKGSPNEQTPVGQWELYDIPKTYTGMQLLGALVSYMKNNRLTRIKAATCIMIRRGYDFKITDIIITNFHQPRSTLLLLVSAFVGEDWRKIYDYALANDFRFLSYGDSSILMKK